MINRLRPATGIALLIVLSFLTAAPSCSPTQLEKNATRVATSIHKAKPVVQKLIDGGAIPRAAGDQFIARMSQGETIATDLATAFRAGNNMGALDLTSQLIGVVDTLISTDVLLIRDQATRTTVLAILAAADLALGFIADSLSKGAEERPQAARAARSARPSAVSKIAEFAKKKRLQCRDSISGQYRKMEECKTHPATTTVETY